MSPPGQFAASADIDDCLYGQRMSEEMGSIGSGAVTPESASGRRGLRAWPWIAVIVALLVGASGTYALTRPAPVKAPAVYFAVRGSVSIADLSTDLGVACYAPIGYGDIFDGAQIVVTDAHGTTVAVGHLGPSNPTTGNSGTSGLRGCQWFFTVDGVPGGRGPYSVEVSHRGKVAFNEADAGNVEIGFS